LLRRDQIERVAARFDCAKLRNQACYVRMALMLICEMSLTQSSGSVFIPAAADHGGGAGRRALRRRDRCP